MKIISVHVQAFGKLNGVKMDLHDGINATKNVNGYGKTTMASFIRAMLFGFTYKTIGGVKDSSRFAPWQGTGRFGGSMTVEHDGQTYRIERFFGATAKQETLSVINEKTGKSLDLQGMQPGEIFLGLTAESYDRSAYFPQEAVELSSNDNFDARLAKLIQNGAEDYDKIQEKLRAYKKNLRYERGNGGVIYELDCKRQQLLQRQSDAARAERRAEEIDGTFTQMEGERQLLLGQREQLKRKQSSLQREVAQAQLSHEEQRAAERLAELNEALRRVPPDFDKDMEICNALARQIDSAEPQQPQQQQDKPKKRNTTLAYLAIVLALVGILFCTLGAAQVLSAAVGYGVGGGCFALIVLGIAAKIALKQRAKRKSAEAATNREELQQRFVQIVRKYAYVDDDYDKAKQRLWETYKRYGEDVRERDTLRSIVKAPTAVNQNAESELAQTNDALREIDEKLNSLAVSFGRLSEERKSLTFDGVAIEDELLTVDEAQKEAEFNFTVADTVIQLLEQAKDNLSSGYLPKLCSRCSELLSQITQIPLSVVVDRSFSVKIREQGLTRDMSAFSRGIREITLLCFRVALSELLYDGAIPFLIIDDAFVNFDEPNFQRATNLLKQLSANAQIIYFTCHERMGELLK